MENDSIRGSGSNTLIDIWVEGKIRAICVSRAAIETFLGPKAPAAMSEDDRCDFVRSHLPQLVKAVKMRLREGNPAADSVMIEAGHLGGGDRRRNDRRKTERRKVNRAVAELPHGERRRGDRRKTDRRQSRKPTPE